MNKETARLIEEHRELRRRVSELESIVGARVGVGWDDRSPCDAVALSAACVGLQRYLVAHENGEEALLRRRGGEAPELREWIEANHRELDALSALLGSVAVSCDGDHVHALRSVLERMRAELEAHMDYEEKVLFPLLERG